MTAHVDGMTRARRAAANSDWTERAGRAGLAARGVVYILLGVIALQIADGGSAEAADKGGALQLLSEQPFGGVLLALLAIGLAGYAAWRLVEAVVYRDPKDHKEWAKRAGYLGRAVIYGAAALAAVSVMRRESGGSGSGSERAWTATLLSWGTVGRLIIGSVAVGFIAAGIWNAYRAVTRKFEKHLESQDMSERSQTAVRVIGIAGLLGRGVAFCAIGWFVGRAAVEANPNAPLGLDESLREVAQWSTGSLGLAIVAVGLMLFGVYSLAEARWRDVSV